MLDGTFGEALATYVHELCHEAGRDGDARFSDALTTALETGISRAPAGCAAEVSTK